MKKLILNNIQGRLSKEQMKSIMAGSQLCGVPCGSGVGTTCPSQCPCYNGYCR